MQNVEDAAYSLSHIKKVVTPQPPIKLYTVHQITFLRISTHMGPPRKQDRTSQEVNSNNKKKNACNFKSCNKDNKNKYV